MAVSRGRAYVVNADDVIPIVHRAPASALEGAPPPSVVSPEGAATVTNMAISDDANRRSGALELFVLMARNGTVWSLPLSYLPDAANGTYSGPGVQ